MRLRECQKPNKKSDGKLFRSSNMIPRNIRTWFKKKDRLSKSYRKVKTINKYISIRKKLLDIDIQLKNHYESKKLNYEIKLFDKANANNNVLYNYVKRKQKLILRLVHS